MDNNYHFFDIALKSINLFSFMLGMTFASFNGFFKVSAFKYVIAYFALLALYFAIKADNNFILNFLK